MNGDRWLPLCRLSDLEPNRGRAALVDGRQLAVFRLTGDAVYVVGNRDPFSGAEVMSRGVIGDRGGQMKVVSPIFKQSFSLTTGECLDDPSARLDVFETRVHGDAVLVRFGAL
jgi:nitrite reductase (NADH) small subunit